MRFTENVLFDYSSGDNAFRRGWYKKHFSGYETIVEIGVSNGASSYIWVECATKKVVGIDLFENRNVHAVKEKAKSLNIDYEYIIGDSCEIDPIECDILFIDSSHKYKKTVLELQRYSPKTKTFIALHDTNMKPVEDAIKAFLAETDQWEVWYKDKDICGLTVLKRLGYDNITGLNGRL